MSAADLDWGRVKALFAQALDQPAPAREGWLAAHAGGDAAVLAELRSLLAAHAASEEKFLDPSALPFDEIARAQDDVDTGSTIGPYRVLRELGSGGMGRVLLAERADGQFSQQVALKLIRAEFAGGDLRDRFLREREILARLNHPHIAQLHDGGVADNGAPYFTLEYIDGAPITRWCDAHRSGVRARLELLLKVCDAVQYAHRNLVVHRDLKPSNILVTAQGEPKLLDFGIAKPLDTSEHLTLEQSAPMTREYAAPEQVLGDAITTATDVYALGVLMYELLSGTLPYARAVRAQTSWPKAIVEETPDTLPRALSRDADAAQHAAACRDQSVPALQRTLRGDLDRIVRRALEKAPEARYPSVTGFADDIRAWLDGRALPGGSRRYRMIKFVRRNRVAVAFSGTLLVVIIASLAIIALQARRVASHAQEALRQAQTTAAVKDFLLDLFHKADPNVAKGKDITARELVDRGVQRLDALPPEQAALKAELQVTLGTIYFQLGLNKQAADLHQAAFDTLKSIGGDAVLTAAAERDLATELVHLNQIPHARDLADDALARLQALPDAPKAELLRCYYTVGWIAQTERNGARALSSAAQAIALARQPPVDERSLALALNMEGGGYWAAHETERSAASYREALQIHQRLFGDDNVLTMADMEGVAAALLNSGRYVEAAEFFGRAYAAYSRVYGAANMRTLNVQQGLALTEYEAGRYADARRDFEQILATLKEHPVQNNEFGAQNAANYALVLADQGDLDPAERELTAARDLLVEKFGDKFTAVTEAVADLGYVHMLQGKQDAAEQDLRKAIANKNETKDDDIATELTWLSDVQRLRGDGAAALASAQQARDVALKIYGERSRQAARAHYALGLALLATHDAARAQSELRASLASFALIVPPDGMHPFSAGPRLALGSVLARDGAHSAEAAKLLDDAVKLRAATYGNDHPLTLEARTALAALKR